MALRAGHMRLFCALDRFDSLNSNRNPGFELVMIFIASMRSLSELRIIMCRFICQSQIDIADAVFLELAQIIPGYQFVPFEFL